MVIKLQKCAIITVIIVYNYRACKITQNVVTDLDRIFSNLKWLNFENAGDPTFRLSQWVSRYRMPEITPSPGFRTKCHGTKCHQQLNLFFFSSNVVSVCCCITQCSSKLREEKKNRITYYCKILFEIQKHQHTIYRNTPWRLTPLGSNSLTSSMQFVAV